MSGLSDEIRERVSVILVRSRNPGNIGAVARAMHDFGFRHLRLVNEYAVPFEAARSAVDAGEVLAGARLFAGVAEAVADCTVVVGTTAVGERSIEHPLLPLREAAVLLQRDLERSPGTGRVGLVFGSEKTGLSNDELSHCHWLLTIPMQQYEEVRHPSMNLGQAVAVCLYELASMDGGTPALTSGPALTAEGRPVSAGEVERVTALLFEVLHLAEYDRHHPAKSDAEQIRRTVHRMAMTGDAAAAWMGMLRQILWKLRGGVRAGP